MKDLKNEINRSFTGVMTKVDLLATLTTEEIANLSNRVQMIENALSVMQEAMLRMEQAIKESNELSKPD
jgi:hypothetical protein